MIYIHLLKLMCKVDAEMPRDNIKCFGNVGLIYDFRDFLFLMNVSFVSFYEMRNTKHLKRMELCEHISGCLVSDMS